MDISLLPSSQQGAAEEFTVTFTTLYLKRWLLYNNQWALQQQCHLIISLLVLLLYSLVGNTSKQKLDSIFYKIFILILVTSNVVFANHAQHPPNHPNDYNDTRNSSEEGIRQGREAATSGASTFVLRPEFFTVPIGGVIHLFPRYGYLSLSMKVISRNNSNLNNGNNGFRNDSWAFLEPINNVIDTSTLKIEETTFTRYNDSSESLPFHNLFHFDLCEDITALMEAYFKNFHIEGLDKPWQAFAGGWRTASIARNYGIDQQYVEGDYRYVLVKVLLVKGSGSVKPTQNTTVSEAYKSNFQRFKPDNDLSTYEFFKVVGTHYIHSYITGNSMYQVYVYDPDGFQAIKKRLFFDGINDQTTASSAEPILESLSMWVKHVGRVIVLNAEPDVVDNVRKALVMHSTNSSPGSNLLKLHDNATLVGEIESLLSSQPNGILAIDFRGVQFLFPDPVQRTGFEKALKHKMQLWEINFLY